MSKQTDPPPSEAGALEASRTPPFKIKDVNCNFLLQGFPDPPPQGRGSPRTEKPTDTARRLVRGKVRRTKGTPPRVVPGIVVGYYSTATPRITNPADYAEYESANRWSFEMFNYVYKVWTPCVKAELDVSDFEEKNKKQFLKKVAAMADVTVSVGANEVQGAIPPGTLVDVKFANRFTLKNPQIVRVKNKLFDISSMFPDPPGKAFVLGAPTTIGTGLEPQGGGYAGDGGGGPEVPGVQRVLKGSKRVDFGPNPLMQTMLEALNAAAEELGIYLVSSSSTRSAYDQVRIMLNNYNRHGGRSYLLRLYGKGKAGLADIFDQTHRSKKDRILEGVAKFYSPYTGSHSREIGTALDLRWAFSTNGKAAGYGGGGPPLEVSQALAAAMRRMSISVLVEVDHYHIIAISDQPGKSKVKIADAKYQDRAAAGGIVKGLLA